VNLKTASHIILKESNNNEALANSRNSINQKQDKSTPFMVNASCMPLFKLFLFISSPKTIYPTVYIIYNSIHHPVIFISVNAGSGYRSDPLHIPNHVIQYNQLFLCNFKNAPFFWHI